MPCKELLIPVRKCRRLSGAFAFGRSVTLRSDHEADLLPLRQLRDGLAALGVRVRPAGSGRSTDVRILRNSQIGGSEGYRLTIRPGGIEILSRSDAGAFYAVQTLRDLLVVHGKTIPAMRIDDTPDFARRGLYFECSRGKVPKVSTVKRLIERLARWKVNELQLYVENVFTFASHPTIGRGYSPLTPEDILAIQDHCKTHHIRLVGSLASFGHMEKILALPEYRSLGELPGHNGWAGGTTLCPGDPGSIRLLRQMYDEFVPLFEAEDFNVCCDEPWELGRGRSKKRAGKIGVGRLYLEFILKIHKLCLRHGKRMNMWADIVLAHPEIIPDIPKDIVMLNWDYDLDGRRIGRTREITGAGLSVLCCPGTHGWQSHGSRLAVSIANVSRFARTARRQQAEGFLNTDWGDYGHRNTLGVSLHGFAHGAAAAWCEAKTDHEHFTERFCRYVFGDCKDRLAPALRVLGDEPSGLLYHALVEPFGFAHGRPHDPKTRIPPQRRTLYESETKDRWLRGRRMTAKRLGRKPLPGKDELEALAVERLEVLRGLRIPKLTDLDDFEALALEEFRLAAQMDDLACRRILVSRKIQTGKRPRAGALGVIAREMRAMSDDFARIWRARNRPSRLRDNLTAFRRTIAETERLAGTV